MPNGTEETRKYKDITLYPVYMRDYDRYLFAKEAWKQRQSFLPVKYVVQPFLQALFMHCLDRDSEAPKDAPKEAFFGILQMLILVCGLDTDIPTLFKGGVLCKRTSKGIVLDSIVFEQNKEKKTITVDEFPVLRKIVAEMNGIELPDERENIDLLRSFAEKLEYENRNAKTLKFRLDNLIETVAYLSQTTYDNVLRWTVKDFERRKSAIDRVERFRIYAQAEMSGMVTFKKGNPCPSLYFDAIDDTYGTVSLEEANLAGAAEEINAAKTPHNQN